MLLTQISLFVSVYIPPGEVFGSKNFATQCNTRFRAGHILGEVCGLLMRRKCSF